MHLITGAFFLVCLKGFEPPTYWFVGSLQPSRVPALIAGKRGDFSGRKNTTGSCGVYIAYAVPCKGTTSAAADVVPFALGRACGAVVYCLLLSY